MAVGSDFATKTGTTTGWDTSVRGNVGLVGRPRRELHGDVHEQVGHGRPHTDAGDDAASRPRFGALVRYDGTLRADQNGIPIAALVRGRVARQFQAGDRIQLSYDGAYTSAG